MFYLLSVVALYLAAGVGFALASWLQAMEIAVNKKTPMGIKDSLMMFLMFTLVWPVMAVICWRCDIKKSAPPFAVVLEMVKERDDAKTARSHYDSHFDDSDYGLSRTSHKDSDYHALTRQSTEQPEVVREHVPTSTYDSGTTSSHSD